MVSEEQQPLVFERFLQFSGQAPSLYVAGEQVSMQAGLMVSDPFLQMQYNYQLSVTLEQVRVHGSYMRGDVNWKGIENLKKPEDILIIDRPHECIRILYMMSGIDSISDTRIFSLES